MGHRLTPWPAALWRLEERQGRRMNTDLKTMMARKKGVEPIPDKFDSYEEAAEFWDIHDTTDYPEAFETVEVQAELQRRRFEVEVDEAVMQALREQARKRGVTVSQIVGDLVRQQM